MATLKVTFTNEEKDIITKYTEVLGCSASDYLRELTLNEIADRYLVARVEHYIRKHGKDSVDLNDIPIAVLAGTAEDE